MYPAPIQPTYSAAPSHTPPTRPVQVKPFVVAQEYVPDPLLINGKKFGIRLWALVTGHEPLKVYLHRGGLVLFSTDQYSAEGDFSAEDGSAAPGHVTNYAQNVDGEVWSLAQLKEHLGPDAFRWGLRRSVDLPRAWLVAGTRGRG